VGFAGAINGDLVFFNFGNDCPPNCPGHVALCEGDGAHIVTATNPTLGVTHTTLAAMGWTGNVMGIRRPLPDDGKPPPPPPPPGGGGPGGGGIGGIPLVLSTRFEKNQWLANIRHIEDWSTLVATNLGMNNSVTPLFLPREFTEDTYRFSLRYVTDFLDVVTDIQQIPSVQLHQSFTPDHYRRTMQELMDFSASYGAGQTPPIGGGDGGGGTGPIEGIDRQAVQSLTPIPSKSFVILLASHGTSISSPTWLHDTAIPYCVANGLEYLFYHFGRGPGHGGDTGANEADFFLNVISSIGEDPFAHGLAYDWEPFQGYTTPESEGRAFVNHVQAQNLLCGVYTFWFKPYPYDWGQDWFWVSYVGIDKPPGRYDIHQYGVIDGVDRDRSPFSVTELNHRTHGYS
jgi:hypothetical protein